MSRIFITGSAEGLGLMAGRRLADQGHQVVLHARSESRAQDAKAALPQAEAVLVGDLSEISAMRDVADQANRSGRFDAVVHSVGLGYRERRRVETVDGLSQLWAVNVLAPYVLTALIYRPDRLVYLSSGMHLSATTGMDDLQWSRRRWSGTAAYSDSKLHDVLLGFAVARHWPQVATNVVSPGWVPTRMGGTDAPDDMDLASLTQAWLAVSDDRKAQASGQFLYHQRPADLHPSARDTDLQERLLDHLRDISQTALN